MELRDALAENRCKSFCSQIEEAWLTAAAGKIGFAEIDSGKLGFNFLLPRFRDQEEVGIISCVFCIGRLKLDIRQIVEFPNERECIAENEAGHLAMRRIGGDERTDWMEESVDVGGCL